MSEHVRKFLRRPLFAALFLVLAVGVWSFILWQNARTAPLRQRIEAGSRLLAQGSGSGAESEWRAATKIDGESAEAWELLGNYYLSSSDWPAALDAFKRVEKLAPQTPALPARLALVSLRGGDFASAEKYSDQVLKTTPDDITALKVAIAVAEQKKDSDKQFALLQHLVELQPDSPEALMTQAAALSAQFRFDEALVPLNHLLKIDPDFVYALALRGEVIYKNSPDQAALKRAESDFKRVLQLDNQNIEGHRYLGRIYLRQNRPQLAVEEFETIGRGRPYASAHLFELSQAYRKAGATAKAEATLKLFNRIEQLNNRIGELRTRIGRNPEAAQLYLQMAQVLLKSLNADDPIYQFYRFHYIARDVADVSYYLDKARALQPDDAKLRELSTQVQRQHASQLAQGLALLQKGDFERADWHLGHALLLRYEDEGTKRALALLKARQNAPSSPAPPITNAFENILPDNSAPKTSAPDDSLSRLFPRFKGVTPKQN